MSDISSHFHPGSPESPGSPGSPESIVKSLQKLKSSLDETAISTFIKPFHEKAFQEKCQQEQFYCLCNAIHEWIKKQKAPCFLLPKISSLIQSINQQQILESPFRFANFEMWLLLFSDLTEEEKQECRDKIAGLSIPRQAYQLLYPIEPGKLQTGAHITCAHQSPDLDTSVTSFWGWLDSFHARIGEGMHIWNLPGGTLGRHDRLIFDKILGEEGLSNFAKARNSLSPLAIDLLQREPMRLVTADAKLSKLTFSHYEDAIVVVDHEGYFLGQWQRKDLARVEAIFSLLSQTFTWIQRELFSRMVAFFTIEEPTKQDFDQLVQEILAIHPCDSALCIPSAPKKFLEETFVRLFGLPSKSFTLSDFASSCEKSIFSSITLQEALDHLRESTLFSEGQKISKASREIFSFIQATNIALEKAFSDLRSWCDRIEVGIIIKEEILNLPSHYISVKAELAEVERMLQKLGWVCAVYPEKSGKLVPVGVITKERLAKRCLGTAALRDFSSSQEIEISKHIDVISIVDHHKCHIHSHFAPVAHISNTQACATLVSELKHTLLRRAKTLAALQNDEIWISSERIFLQNFALLLAILDDTDRLKKAGDRDLEAVASLLNEILALHEKGSPPLPSHPLLKDVLEHPQIQELFSMLDQRRVACLREEITLASQEPRNNDPSLFRDTKIQNRSSRVGQIKLLPQVSSHFMENAENLRLSWAKRAKAICQSQNHLCLHLQMISTLSDDKSCQDCPDMLWIWCDGNERGYEHLTHFLRGFKASDAIEKEKAWMKQNPKHKSALSVTVYASEKEAKPLKDLVFLNFLEDDSRIIIHHAQEPHICISYRAGSINSRKSLISPYLF